jgi:hypothetical protein
MALQRLVLDFRSGELVVRTLYRRTDGPNPGTKARAREVQELTRNEELWKESVRAYEEKRRQMARLEWHAFHCGQAERHRRTLEDLIAHHEAAAARLCED